MTTLTATTTITCGRTRKIPELKKRIRSNANQAAYNFARAVVVEAKVRVPKRTGYLASQIKWERISPGVFDVFVDGNINTKTGAYYGIYVEYGTRNMAAQPYFKPSVEAQKVAFRRDMKAVFRDARIPMHERFQA